MSTIEGNAGRRGFLKLAGVGAALLSPAARMVAQAKSKQLKQVSLTSAGCVAGGSTMNTAKIQAAIDKLASSGGGTIVVPQGVFLTGAIDLKPGVHLHLDAGGVLKGSTDTKDYPMRKTRVEGHFQDWLPALVNADGCNGLRVSGEGTLDGSGAPFWKAFWDARAANNKTANLDVPRPRMMLLMNSKDVEVKGIHFKDSGFWNLHMYNCQQVLVENVEFRVPDGVKCPSTDGTDIDSCQGVTIRGCSYSVDDDCVCLKGSKGPFAMDDKLSPAVENIRIENCTFYRGGGILTLGSEATTVRNVIAENNTIKGHTNVLRLKLRPDTPQLYEDVHIRNVTLESTGAGGQIINCASWKQYFDLKGQAPPKAVVRNISISNVKGHLGSFGVIQGNPGQTSISGITFENIDVTLETDKLTVDPGLDVKLTNVVVNGKPFSLKTA